MDDREIMFERLAGAQAIIPAISGWDHAHQKAMNIAAYLSIVEGRTLTHAEFIKLENGIRDDAKPKPMRKRR